MKRHPCWACSFHHCHTVTIKEGPYAGLVADEPDYEDFAMFGSQINQTDPMAVIVLNDLSDRLGLDANECGWLLGMLMESYEKNVINKTFLDGIELTWGNVEAVQHLLKKIARREGVGGILAEGTVRAAESIGGEAPDIGIYIKTGAVPRGHDHRARWEEMLDTATSSTSTVDSLSNFNPPALAGIPPASEPFNGQEVARIVAGTKGRHAFEDSAAICSFTCRSCEPKLLTDALNAVTGWGWKIEDVPIFGQMVSNLLRCFDLRHGRRKEDECPSPRYSSVPEWGPAKGISTAAVWDVMREKYYYRMGWDQEMGKPLPETLRAVGLEELIKDLWPEGG
jgi:aldehyde:ferredoxin oxidoreductase